MALDTFQSIVGKVCLHCPAASPLLARDWVSDAFRQLAERRSWSWLLKRGQFIFPAVYNTGTVTVTLNSTTVTGSGVTWDNSFVGRQFRIGSSTPIYTIASVTNSTTLELTEVWGSTTRSAVGYEIYLAYVTPPSDFHAFHTVWDPNYNWQLRLNYSQKELNLWDAQRSNSGQAYLLAAADYSRSSLGTVSSVTQVLGSGNDPVSTGTYTAPTDAIFTIEVTTGGTTGTAVFRWKKNEGSYTSTVTSSATAQDLSDGVQIYWPTGVAYTLGDMWVIRCTAVSTIGLPRFEAWPHVKQSYVLPFIYESRAVDLEDPGAVLPRFIRGDVLLQMALAEAARWPGPDPTKPSIYFNLQLAKMHSDSAEFMIMELERQDEEVYLQDVCYTYSNLEFSPLGDAAWLQSHAI